MDNTYERFSCATHIGDVRRLIALDFSGRCVAYSFEPVESIKEANQS